MSPYYKVRRINNKRFEGEKPLYSISLVSSHNTTLDELAEIVNAKCSFTQGDVTGLIDNLSIFIADELASGRTVTLDGLGTFSLSAELISPVEDPEKITGKDIRLKKVCFKPAPEFKQRIAEHMSFIKLPSGVVRWRR